MSKADETFFTSIGCKGIIIHGHQECAGNPIDDEKHKEDIRKSIGIIKSLVNSSAMVIGVFVKRSPSDPRIWEVEELSSKHTV